MIDKTKLKDQYIRPSVLIEATSDVYYSFWWFSYA